MSITLFIEATIKDTGAMLMINPNMISTVEENVERIRPGKFVRNCFITTKHDDTNEVVESFADSRKQLALYAAVGREIAGGNKNGNDGCV